MTIPSVRPDGTLEGLITVGDITKTYMNIYDSSILSKANTQYSNIIETLEADLLVGMRMFTLTRERSSSPQRTRTSWRIISKSMIWSFLATAMSRSCARSRCRRAVLWYALAHRCPGRFSVWRGTATVRLFVTPLDTYAVARLINQSMPVDFLYEKRESYDIPSGGLYGEYP